MATARGITVDPANEAQARAWDGDEGAYWAARAEHYERSMAAYRDAFFAAAAIRPRDRVLDVGCGTGGTTRDAARAAYDGSVLGLDLSAAMLDRARVTAAAEGLTNVDFVQGDAQVHTFAESAFDVAVAQSVAMFFGDPVAALRNVARALVPGGRLVLLTWRPIDGNEWLREFRAALAAGRDLPLPPAGAPGPFGLSDPGRIRAVLDAASYRDAALEPVDAPMWFGRDAGDAYGFLLGQLGWLLEGLDDAARAGALAALRDSLTAHESPAGVTYASAAWLTTARRA